MTAQRQRTEGVAWGIYAGMQGIPDQSARLLANARAETGTEQRRAFSSKALAEVAQLAATVHQRLALRDDGAVLWRPGPHRRRLFTPLPPVTIGLILHFPGR